MCKFVKGKGERRLYEVDEGGFLVVGFGGWAAGCKVHSTAK